jgi:hypothetical protein
MLSREDSRRLAQLERQLRHDDPGFCARMEDGKPETPPRRRPVPLSLIFAAAVIWIAAVVLGIVGWWIAAAIAALWATVVVAGLVVQAYRRGSPTGPHFPDSPISFS